MKLCKQLNGVEISERCLTTKTFCLFSKCICVLGISYSVFSVSCRCVKMIHFDIGKILNWNETLHYENCDHKMLRYENWGCESGKFTQIDIWLLMHDTRHKCYTLIWSFLHFLFVTLHFWKSEKNGQSKKKSCSFAMTMAMDVLVKSEQFEKNKCEKTENALQRWSQFMTITCI